MRSRFRRLAWAGPSAEVERRQARTRKGIEDGQRDIRRLLIIGAMAVVRWASRRRAPDGSWLARLMLKKPRMLVAIALANKMARVIWAC